MHESSMLNEETANRVNDLIRINIDSVGPKRSGAAQTSEPPRSAPTARSR